jgi:hypothetical protein
MIERAWEYVWATSRVLEQRRFELLFGDGDADAVAAALAPYRTPDGGYGYALEPDGRGPTSQPPHIWTALEVLEELGRAPDAALAEHVASLAAPDGGLPVALPSMEAWPHAPWWGIGSEGTLLATALVYSRLHVEHPWRERAEAFCWARIEEIEKTHPYEVEAAITFLDAAGDRARAQAQAARLGELVRAQDLVGVQPEGYTVGEIHHPHDFAKRPDSLARAWFSDAEIADSLDVLASQQREHGGWEITWAHWLPAIPFEWSGIVTIEALKTLRAYGRL